jgi:RHS repeat-associated protein
LQRPAAIAENGKSATFAYGHDCARRKMEVKNGATLQYTRYYLGDRYEKDVRPDKTATERLYFGGTAYNAPAVYVRVNGGAWTLYYIHRDHLGSITGLSSASGTLTHEYSYDPWGRLRNPANHVAYPPDQAPELFLGRGFTGHEHLPQFGLINMNARLYDPALGRFLSPDPYVQAPDFSQSFNRYSYCVNNPLIYVDENGEWFGLDDLIGFAVGGVINLVSNALQGNIHSIGDGLAAFGAGGAAGTLALYGPAGWAAGGAIVGGTNAWLGGATGWDIAKGAGIGVVSGLAGGAAGQWAAQSLGGIVISGLRITSPVLQGAIGGAIGGAAGGYAGGFAGGLLMTGDFNQAHKAGLSGAISGASIGSIAGAVGGYAAAKKAEINPWTGKQSPWTGKQSDNLYKVGTNTDQDVFIVTEDGVVLPKGAEIPEYLIENPKYHGKGSYGIIDQNGNFQETVRIDKGTPHGYKGPNESHFHLNKGKHIFDANKWPWWRK